MPVSYELFWACAIIIKGLWKALISNVAKISTQLTHIDQEFIWDETQEHVF
jgi:hypothetical protein